MSVKKIDTRRAKKVFTKDQTILPNLQGLENRVTNLEEVGTSGSSSGTLISVDTSPEASGIASSDDVCKAVRITDGPPDYALAQADSLINAESIGIISEYETATQFKYVQAGELTKDVGVWNNACDEDLALNSPPGLEKGVAYFLSPDTPGNFTKNPPTVDGEIINPLFIGTSKPDTALVLPYRGNQIGSGISKGTYFTQSNFTWNAVDEVWEFPFTHGLDNKYPIVWVYDENDQPVTAIAFRPTSGSETSSLTLRFSDALYDTLASNTWYLRVVGNGENANVDISSADPQPVGATADPGSSGEYSDAGHVHEGNILQFAKDTHSTSGAYTTDTSWRDISSILQITNFTPKRTDTILRVKLQYGTAAGASGEQKFRVKLNDGSTITYSAEKLGGMTNNWVGPINLEFYIPVPAISTYTIDIEHTHTVTTSFYISYGHTEAILTVEELLIPGFTSW